MANWVQAPLNLNVNNNNNNDNNNDAGEEAPRARASRGSRGGRGRDRGRGRGVGLRRGRGRGRRRGGGRIGGRESPIYSDEEDEVGLVPWNRVDWLHSNHEHDREVTETLWRGSLSWYTYSYLHDLIHERIGGPARISGGLTRIEMPMEILAAVPPPALALGQVNANNYVPNNGAVAGAAQPVPIDNPNPIYGLHRSWPRKLHFIMTSKGLDDLILGLPLDQRRSVCIEIQDSRHTQALADMLKTTRQHRPTGIIFTNEMDELRPSTVTRDFLANFDPQVNGAILVTHHLYRNSRHLLGIIISIDDFRNYCVPALSAEFLQHNSSTGCVRLSLTFLTHQHQQDEDQPVGPPVLQGPLRQAQPFNFQVGPGAGGNGNGLEVPPPAQVPAPPQPVVGPRMEHEQDEYRVIGEPFLVRIEPVRVNNINGNNPANNANNNNNGRNNNDNEDDDIDSDSSDDIDSDSEEDDREQAGAGRNNGNDGVNRVLRGNWRMVGVHPPGAQPPPAHLGEFGPFNFRPMPMAVARQLQPQWQPLPGLPPPQLIEFA